MTRTFGKSLRMWSRSLFVFAAILVAIGFSSSVQAQGEKEGVLTMERDLALVLNSDGLDEFAARFHGDINLWIEGDEVARAAYLPGAALNLAGLTGQHPGSHRQWRPLWHVNRFSPVSSSPCH